MLPNSRGVFLRNKSACGRLIDDAVVGGTLNLMKRHKIHKVHAPQIQGHVFEKKTHAAGSQSTGWFSDIYKHSLRLAVVKFVRLSSGKR